MKIRYIGESTSGVQIGDVVCRYGEPVEFDEATGAKLVEQGTFEAVARPTKTKES